MSIELLSAVATILGVAGVVLNNRKMVACFYLWIVSNGLCLLIHYQAGLMSLMFRDGIFVLLALEGIWQWGKKQRGAFNVERKQAETIKRLKADNDALEAMVAALENDKEEIDHRLHRLKIERAKQWYKKQRQQTE